MNLVRYYVEFTPQDRPCPITGILYCDERSCELHYMDAPLNLKEQGLCHSDEGDLYALMEDAPLERDYLD